MTAKKRLEYGPVEKRLLIRCLGDVSGLNITPNQKRQIRRAAEKFKEIVDNVFDQEPALESPVHGGTNKKI
ncbi:MAG: hypothetical protein Q7S22_00335 [Candidatus Micrarchaeota archaeon]|nr:hypothetical protein [Candidatus Micrarchaeota archaeon]